MDFYKSEYFEVKAFFESKYSTYTGHIKQKTIGWGDTKKMMLERAKLNAQLKMQEDLEELYKPTMREISQMYYAVMKLAQFKLKKMLQSVSKDEKGNVILWENYDIREVEKIWKIVKKELEEFGWNNSVHKYWTNPLKKRLEELKNEQTYI